MTDSPPRFPRTFHVVAKPLGATCNVDCAYCYYHYKDTAPGRISDELLEKFIRTYIAAQEEDPVMFNWHGGEPTLLGIDFFRTRRGQSHFCGVLPQKSGQSPCRTASRTIFRPTASCWTRRGARSSRSGESDGSVYSCDHFV
jgi:hypothetical protein